MSTIAIIPARGGSKGVPQKNIRLLKGFPLIAYSIAAGVLSNSIDRIVVSTDSVEIAEISRSFGAEVPFIRPDQFATDQSPDIEFVLHALQWFSSNEGQTPKYFVHLRPTTPLRDPKIIDRAVAYISQHPEATSLRSGHIAPESPFKWFLRNEAGYFTSILAGTSNESANLPRQSFPTVYVPDGYVDVLKTDYITASKSLHGDKMVGFQSPFCCEVDTVDDFEYLEFIIEQKGSILLDYLQTKFS